VYFPELTVVLKTFPVACVIAGLGSLVKLDRAFYIEEQPGISVYKGEDD